MIAVPPEDVALMRALVADGMAINEVARKFEVTSRTVRTRVAGCPKARAAIEARSGLARGRARFPEIARLYATGEWTQARIAARFKTQQCNVGLALNNPNLLATLDRRTRIRIHVVARMHDKKRQTMYPYHPLTKPEVNKIRELSRRHQLTPEQLANPPPHVYSFGDRAEEITPKLIRRVLARAPRDKYGRLK